MFAGPGPESWARPCLDRHHHKRPLYLRRFVYSHDDETGKGEPKTPVRTPELPSTLQGRTR